MNIYNSTIVSIRGLAVFLGVVFSSSAYPGIFVDWDEIPGDSQVERYEGQIEISAISGDFRRNICGGFTIEKSLDQASARLIGAAFNGNHFPEVVVELTNDRKKGQELYFKIELQNVVVDGVSTYAVVDDRPVEQVRLSAQSVTFTPYTIDPTTGNSTQGATVEIDCTSPG